MYRPRIIIAEDFVLIQEAIRGLVEVECDVVAAVEDGREAINAVATHRPDILLIDVSLPRANGFTVTEKVLGQSLDVKILFVSAHGEKSYVKRAFELGAKGYLLKSSIRAELLPAIREVMDGGLYRSP